MIGHKNHKFKNSLIWSYGFSAFLISVFEDSTFRNESIVLYKISQNYVIIKDYSRPKNIDKNNKFFQEEYVATYLKKI